MFLVFLIGIDIQTDPEGVAWECTSEHSSILCCNAYGLLNNFWVYILPTMISAYNMILIKTYIEQLSPALEESASLDGAGYLTCFQYLLYNYLNEAQRLAEQLKNASSGADMTQAMASISPKGIRMTITVLASLPIFALYPFMQKYFSKGIMVGAVKG